MNRSIRERIAFAHFSLVHRCPPFIIRQWQTTQLRRLLQHTFLYVPMWRDIFSGTRVSKGQIRELGDLAAIPLTSKDTYIGRMVEEYIDNGHRFTPRWNSTSGTSGKPFRSLLSSQYIEDTSYAGFALFRFLLWNGGHFGDIASTKIAHIKQKTYSSPFRLGLNYADFLKDQKNAYLQLAEFKPEVLMAYPSVLFDIARMMETDTTLPMLTPRYISSSGEILTPQVRSFVSEQLGAEVYNRYALEEIGVVGTECNRHNGFHVNSESIIIEITDESGKPLPEGEHGKVIVTDLLNYNMPFIRYDTGDRGSISFAPCACGLYTPRLWLKSRSSAYLTFGNRRIYRHEFIVLDELMHSVFQYQVVKHGENELLLRIVPGPTWKETIVEEIKKNLLSLFGGGIRISVELVSNIPKTTRGKSNLIVDETGPASSLLS